MQEQKSPKIIVALIAVVALIIIFVFSSSPTKAPTEPTSTPISITKETITEANFSGVNPLSLEAAYSPTVLVPLLKQKLLILKRWPTKMCLIFENSLVLMHRRVTTQ